MRAWEVRQIAITAACVAGGGLVVGGSLALLSAGGPETWDGRVPARSQVLEQAVAPPAEAPASKPGADAAVPAEPARKRPARKARRERDGRVVSAAAGATAPEPSTAPASERRDGAPASRRPAMRAQPVTTPRSVTVPERTATPQPGGAPAATPAPAPAPTAPPASAPAPAATTTPGAPGNGNGADNGNAYGIGNGGPKPPKDG